MAENVDMVMVACHVDFVEIKTPQAKVTIDSLVQIFHQSALLRSRNQVLTFDL